MSARGASAFCVAMAAVLALHPDLALAAAQAQDATAAVGAAGPAPEPSVFGRVIAWILDQQRAFHRELTQGLRSLGADGGMNAALGLILASFLYGVFHAAGPGHGKAILTTYLLTHKEHVVRGVWLSVAAALCQGLTAAVLVYGMVALAGWLPGGTPSAVAWSERVSYVLVLLVGAVLSVRAIGRLAPALRTSVVPHRLMQGAAGLRRRAAGQDHHAHHDPHARHCGCGHVHALSAEQIARRSDVRTTLALIFSIGFRPCSGAILVLVFARVTGLGWAGIAAVAAMSAGTALAIAGLALLAVNARQWVASMARERRSRYRVVGDVVALAGGILVVAIGVSLVTASFAPSHPLAPV